MNSKYFSQDYHQLNYSRKIEELVAELVRLSGPNIDVIYPTLDRLLALRAGAQEVPLLKI